MATRRKAKSKRKKATRRRAPARKKAARRKAARKKTSRKGSAKKKAPARRAAAAESLARRIVRATTGDPSKFKLEDLYAEGCTSREASGETVTGFSGLEQKLRQWQSMQESTTWKPRNVFINRNTICIEWDAQVKMRDGRVVDFSETAVHEVKGGKIVSERYYYDPGALAPPAPQTGGPASFSPPA